MPSTAPVRYRLPARADRVVLPSAEEAPAPVQAVLPAAWAAARRFAPAAEELPPAADTAAPEGPARRGRALAWALLAAGLALALGSAVAWVHLQGQLAAARTELRTARQALVLAQARQQQGEADRARRMDAALASVHRELSALTAREAQAGQARSHLLAGQEHLQRRLAATEAALKRPAAGAAGDSTEAVFKRIFARARGALLYIHTRYRVRIGDSGDEEEMTATGTGFLVSPHGVAMTARHVLYPWLYNSKLMAAQSLGLLKVEQDSVRISVWLAGRRVTDGDGGDAPLVERDAYRRDAHHTRVRLLYVGRSKTHEETVMTLAGPTAVSMPRLGRGDVAVFQLVDPGRRFPHLKLAPHPALGALDDVLVVGFPLARLLDGRAVPQPTEGRVRRVGGAMLELDAALHPGSSGGPVLDRKGRVVAMASAILDSPVYGLALPGKDLQAAWQATVARTAAEQRRLRALGCYAGPVNGRRDARTLAAEDCAAPLPLGL